MQERYYRYIVDEVLPMVHEINGTGQLPLTLGCSLGATHAAIVFFRRPDLFGGVLGMSGCYDATYFTDGWCDENLYNNSPVHFLENMPSDHPYIQLYNERKIILCVGQATGRVRESVQRVRWQTSSTEKGSTDGPISGDMMWIMTGVVEKADPLFPAVSC